MKFLLTGASGLIGKKLVENMLSKGYDINILTTSKNLNSNYLNIKKFYWNPENNIIDPKCIIGVKTIINLAGSPIAQLWTKFSKKSILYSRVKSVELLTELIKKNKIKIDHFYCASAIGIYKSKIGLKHDEKSFNISNSFLGNTVKKWESSCDDLVRQNINVTLLRIGLVLSMNGGLLKPVVNSIKYYLGTWFGKGNNIYSWIHEDDLVNSILFLVKNKKSGIYNLVAPNPVSSKLFTIEISKILNKKIFFPPVPKKIIKLFTGSMSELLLFSQDVSSNKLKSEGFEFKFNKLSPALRDLLK
jgi:uncharacterized protein (TIGR01777 family)